ncbi:hypothetical protein HC248_00471 [Polaromonas vacuolata]|uniref:Integrase catalytic domain-containing protein n=2 Tax=Polaromonas vacuolata TaxID=37448 RepID=A0A6H2H5W2_9BURK|nr:hypothetical protein HC248_00471 [Polaromonas vacuolata]
MKSHLDAYRMAALCAALSVSRSGYYAWLARPQRATDLHDAIRACHTAHKARVGAPSIHAELVGSGLNACVRTVGRHMHYLGLRAKGSQKFKRTTDSNHGKLASPNLLERQFEVCAPNQVWVGDITYIRTAQGWLYLATVIDLYSRAVVGWQMSGRIDSKLVCDALQAAILTRGKPTGVMVHTDQGSQYVSNAYRKILRESLLIQSMSRRGNCWQIQVNAVAESFFGTLKKQAIHGEYFATRELAKQAVFEYIEAYYNRIRRHSTVGWLSPLNFENLYSQSLEDSAVH